MLQLVCKAKTKKQHNFLFLKAKLRKNLSLEKMWAYQKLFYGQRRFSLLNGSFKAGFEFAWTKSRIEGHEFNLMTKCL